MWTLFSMQNLIMYWLKNIIGSWFYTRPMTYPRTGYWHLQVYYLWFPICWEVLKSNQKVVNYLDVHATVVPTSCWACHCSLQCLQLDKNEHFSPLIKWLAHPSTMKASHKQWSFQTVTAWFLHVLWLGYVVSSAIGTYHQFWRVTKSNGNSKHDLGNMWDPTGQQLQ